MPVKTGFFVAIVTFLKIIIPLTIFLMLDSFLSKSLWWQGNLLWITRVILMRFPRYAIQSFRERERESIARAKEEIQGNISSFQHVIVNRIRKSHFSLKRKRFEISKGRKLLVLYFLYADEKYNPLIYLESIGC